ncbi:class I SAM-dependent methyltransferase [Rhodococcus sp. EPR-134]|uniref:class I SAM-dependent methyltransferase n=1 Tax=Rhodococcus sp. EPR-134 TaxID=1813675 RepID=UPI0009EDB3A9|nr:class I SAM-dependent methyltransferase [Rhodococcus sp. EPR-134]
MAEFEDHTNDRRENNRENTGLPGRADTGSGDTTDTEYTARLRELQGAKWKRILNVQAPDQWNIRRFLGGRKVLDVGCGIGRNLRNLPPGSVGVDHNEHSVEFCRSVGFEAYSSAEFHSESDQRTFDGMLMAHLLEHLPAGEASGIVAEYLPFLEPGATVMLICPQERGFASDPTHTVFLDGVDLEKICADNGLVVRRSLSFPFPRWMGKPFIYNESVVIAEVPSRL